jgi:hypothetical protein
MLQEAQLRGFQRTILLITIYIKPTAFFLILVSIYILLKLIRYL